MYDRIFKPLKSHSFFIFGPRATGKSFWLKKEYPQAPYFDLLDDEVLFDLQGDPKSLARKIPSDYHGAIIVDEVQKLPKLLDEIHRLMELHKKWIFVLSGSSARKLKRHGVNLLASRALYEKFFPLTAQELGADFNLKKALQYGMLPKVWTEPHPEAILKSYILTYIDQEVKLEGIIRNISQFNKFLQAASFSQGQPLNISRVSSDCGVERRTVTNYFEILEDLLIAHRIPIFSKRAKRSLIKHDKFYFFDVGIFQILRPRGLLDSESEIIGSAAETLVFQHLNAYNSLYRWNYELFYWHSRSHIEVDFILYGKKGFHAIEVKSGSQVRKNDLIGLKEFRKDYKEAKLITLYGGDRRYYESDILIMPLADFFKEAHQMF